MDESRQIPAEGADPAEPGPARVLVIDDEEVVHVSLKRMLGRRGHQVEAVSSAREGLERLAASGGAGEPGFDLVITDLMMPEMDGIALLEELGRHGCQVSVLMITGYPTIRTALQALRLGAVDYLAKPFTRQELLAPVSRALRRGAGQPAAGAGEPGLAAPGHDDGIQTPRSDLQPGERVALPRHSWAVFRQDGEMAVGIASCFLRSVGRVTALALPAEGEIVEQGYVGIRLMTAAGDEHGVFMPISGPVVAVNAAVAAAPSTIDAETWLVRVVPNRLERELEVLVRQDPCE